MEIIRKITSFAVVTVLSTTAFSADLMQLYREAVVNDSQMAISKSKHRASEEIVPQAMSMLLPTVVFTANTSSQKLNSEIEGNSALFSASQTIDESYSSNGYQLSISQPLFNADRWLNYQNAKQIKQGADIELQLSKQQLAMRVAEAYFNVLRAKEALTLAETEESAYNRQLDQVKKTYKSGLIAKTDILDTQAAYDTAKINRIVAENSLSMSLEALSILTGKPVKVVDGLVETMPILPLVPETESAWILKAEQNNKLLKINENSIQVADRELTRRKAEHLPTLNLTASYADASNKGYDIYGNEYQMSTIRLDLTIPVFLGGMTASRVRQANQYKIQADQGLEYHKRVLHRNIINLVRLVKTAVLRVKAAEQAVESNKIALEATKKGYRVGSKNLFELLQSQRLLFAAQRDYANSRYDYILSSLNLKMEAGVLSEKDLQKYNKYLKSGI
ncbi:MAG: hypothetical protein D6B27_01830 [Gammaproteobacteria bacterium]|nr:MAG: hypothetical protein D6B27_01830 [Gammaproteobacteria bacterium]